MPDGEGLVTEPSLLLVALLGSLSQGTAGPRQGSQKMVPEATPTKDLGFCAKVHADHLQLQLKVFLLGTVDKFAVHLRNGSREQKKKAVVVKAPVVKDAGVCETEFTTGGNRQQWFEVRRLWLPLLPSP